MLYEKKLRDKVGASIVVCARAGGSNAILALQSFYAIQRMRITGDVIAYGRKTGEVMQDVRGVEDARSLGYVVEKAICAGN